MNISLLNASVTRKLGWSKMSSLEVYDTRILRRTRLVHLAGLWPLPMASIVKTTDREIKFSDFQLFGETKRYRLNLVNNF